MATGVRPATGVVIITVIITAMPGVTGLDIVLATGPGTATQDMVGPHLIIETVTLPPTMFTRTVPRE